MQSSILKTYKSRLFSQLKDTEYRRAFVDSHISNGVSFQIRELRNNRKLNQKELGKLAGMKQETISRLENPNYGSFTLKTLKNIAAAFDVALIIKFAPFSELVEWDLNLSTESLNVTNFANDPYFDENDQIATIASSEYTDYQQPTASDDSVHFDEPNRKKTMIDMALNHADDYQYALIESS